MNKMFDLVNPLQLTVAIVGIIIFLLLPVVGFGILGISLFGLSGFQLLQLNYLIFLLPLLLLVVMAVCSLSSLRKASIVVGTLCCLTTLITSLMAGSILLSNIAPLLAFIPQEVSEQTGLNFNTASVVLKSIINPGLGSILIIILSVVYCLFAFIPGRVDGGSTSGAYSGNPQDGNNFSSTGVYGRDNIRL